MHSGFFCIAYILLIVTILNSAVLGNEPKAIQLKSQFKSLSLAKELISNSISIVHLQSILMVMSSKRDHPFNISSKLNYIRHPQSYRTTLVQVSSDLYKTFSSVHSTMNRIQLATKQIPSYIKTILRLLNAGSPLLIEKMLPTSLNNIVRITTENEMLINKTIDQFSTLYNLLNEIKQLPIDLSSTLNNPPSDKTDLIVYHQFDSKNILEKICITIQQMKKQFQQMNIKTNFQLSHNDNIIRFIPILYKIENNAYFLNQLSSIYTDILNRYIVDQTAGMGRYVVLQTDEERFASLSNLSGQLSSSLDEIDQLFIERQKEFEKNSVILQQAYDKLFYSSTANFLESK